MQAQLTNGDSAREPVQHFRSADSVPVKYAIARSAWLVPIFLVLFGLASAFVIGYSREIALVYQELLAKVNGLRGGWAIEGQSLGLRPFFALLILFIGLFSAGPLHGRLRFTIPIFSVYVLAVFGVDSILLNLRSMGTPPPFSTFGSLIAGFIGVGTVALGVFSLYHLPEDNVVHRRVKRRNFRYYMVLLVSVAAAITLMVLAFGPGAAYVNELRGLSLLGGLGPGFAVFLPTVLMCLFLIGWLDVTVLRAVRNRKWRRALESGRIAPSQLPEVAFLIAAYNEEAQIRDCILTLDRAAARYDGVVRMYLVDNNSKDATKAVARAAIDECVKFNHETLNILDCLTPGKSHALNYGLLRASEEIVVRVDADTIVDESLLVRVMPYFQDPNVGGVTGMPLPKKRFSVFGLLRAIEIYYSVGFNRLAQSAIDAVMVLPGIMTAYRREPLVELGGFAEGINGEDTDMSVRIGRLGYKLLVDPTIRFYTEVPASFAHLREQRLRWSRSLYHVAARNMSAIRMRQGTRGWWVMTWAVYFSSRRMIVMPIMVYGILLFVADPTNPALRQGATLGALVIGPQIFFLTIALLFYRQWALVPLIPAFLAFKFIRGYFAFESFFTLPAIATVPVAARREEPAAAAAGVAIPTPAGGAVGPFNGSRAPSQARPIPAPSFAMAPVAAVRDGADLGWLSEAGNGHRGAQNGNGHSNGNGHRNGHTNGTSSNGHVYENGNGNGHGRGADLALSSSHPIRRVKLLTDQALERLSGTFESLDGKVRSGGGVSPATLVKASILMTTHDIRDEYEFCDEVSRNDVFAWFMDLDPANRTLDPEALISFGRKLFQHGVARQFVEAVTKDARRRGLYPGSPLLVGKHANGRSRTAYESRQPYPAAF